MAVVRRDMTVAGTGVGRDVTVAMAGVGRDVVVVVVVELGVFSYDLLHCLCLSMYDE